MEGQHVRVDKVPDILDFVRYVHPTHHPEHQKEINKTKCTKKKMQTDKVK
jgi:hypothetical protein